MLFRRTTEQRLAKLESTILGNFVDDWQRKRAARKICDIGGPRAVDILVRALEGTFKPEEWARIDVPQAARAEREQRYRESQRTLRNCVVRALIELDAVTAVIEALARDLEGTLEVKCYGQTTRGFGDAHLSKSDVEAVRSGRSCGEIANALISLLRDEAACFSNDLLHALAALDDPSKSRHISAVQFSDPDAVGWSIEKIDLAKLREAARLEIERRHSASISDAVS